MNLINKCKTQKALIVMALPFFIHLLIFKYIPISGSIMAFQNYNPRDGILGSEWIGFEHFLTMIKEKLFYEVLRNTLAMAFMKLIIGSIGALILAIFLHETKNKFFKSSVQTITTLPNFIAWTVAASLVIKTLSPYGVVNDILQFFSRDPDFKRILFMGEPKYYWWISTLSQLWKNIGWNAIIFLAAMTGIDQQLYEAAKVDGANRMQRIWHITIPGIMPTITILLLISIGFLIDGGYEQQFLLRNGLNQSHSNVIEIFEVEIGLMGNNYSFGTAVGIFKSVVSFILLTSANLFSKKMGQETLF